MLKFADNEPALILTTRRDRILTIPDLHLGFEKELASKGVNIPSQTDRIYSRIEALIRRYNPTKLVFLGDIKHGTSKILPQEWLDIPEFFEKLLKLVKDIEITPGNHDGNLRPLLPTDVKLHSARGLIIRDGNVKIALTHGHTWPDPEALSSNILIMAHHHLTIEFHDPSGLRILGPIWLTTKWNKSEVASAYLKSKNIRFKNDPLKSFSDKFNFRVKDTRIVVAPTYNPMLTGRAVNTLSREEYLGPIFRSQPTIIEDSQIYLLDGTYLGRLSNLKKIARESHGY